MSAAVFLQIGQAIPTSPMELVTNSTGATKVVLAILIVLSHGLRKGELCGLRKCDVDLDASLITVRCSYDRETTKGGHADVIPVAPALAPYLHDAIDASPSDLMFAWPDGSMR